jgi:hypothetical protein
VTAALPDRNQGAFAFALRPIQRRPARRARRRGTDAFSHLVIAAATPAAEARVDLERKVVEHFRVHRIAVHGQGLWQQSVALRGTDPREKI